MTFVEPVSSFKCGACGTTVTALYSLDAIKTVMASHAKDCPGFPPSPTNPPAAHRLPTNKELLCDRREPPD